MAEIDGPLPKRPIVGSNMTPLDLLKNAPTPRTDKEAYWVEMSDPYDEVWAVHQEATEDSIVSIRFARSLERENAALREALVNCAQQKPYAVIEATELLAALDKE